MEKTHEEQKAMSYHVDDTHSPSPVEVKTIKGSAGFNEALIKEPPRYASLTTWRLVGCLLLGCFCQTMNGFDGSLFGGLTANHTFLDFFHGSNSGKWAAYNSAMYQIGGVVALPFVGAAVDTWGRRIGMVIGGSLVVLGTVLNGLTILHGDLGLLKGGRFILGFGCSIITTAGPIYVVETAHPAWRGIITAYCNTFWFTGAILSSGAVRGGLNLTGNISWQIPIWLQMVFPGLVCLFVWFIPESPRWLYAHGKKEQARATLVKWHGYGNPDSAWVNLQVAEYEEFINQEGSDKRPWDYSALFGSRSGRYRIACNVIFSVFGQWAGNGVLTYFLPAVLTTAGYTDSITQANINLGYSCFQFVFALFGAAFVERVGRRRMMISSMAGCSVVWIGITTATALFQKSDEKNSSAAQATIALIFIFGAVFSVGITPLQALYPVEVLSYEMRAKGMAFSSLAVNAGGLLNQFAWPISLSNIGWHTYIVFVIWDIIQTAVFYFMMPETRKRTLEELDQVFEARSPVKASLMPRVVEVARDGTIVAEKPLVDEA